MSSDARQLARLMRTRAAIAVGGLAISVLMIGLTMSKLRLEDVGLALSHAVIWPWIPITLVVYCSGLFLKGLRLKMLASPDAQLTTVTATNIVTIGLAANNILPCRLGEFVRAGLLSERTGLPYAQSLTIAIVERLLDIFALIVLCLLAASSFPLTGWMLELVQIVSLFLVAGTLVLAAIPLAPQLLITGTSRICKFAPPPVRAKALGLVGHVIRGLACFRDGNKLASLLTVSIALWLVESIYFLMLMPCLGWAVSFPKAQLVMSITAFGTLVPSAPGFVGTYHFACMQALKAVMATGTGATVTTVSDVESAAFATLAHSTFFITTTVWGVMATASYGFTTAVKSTLMLQAKPLTELPQDIMAQLPVIKALPAQETQFVRPGEFWPSLAEAIISDDELKTLGEKRCEVVAYAADFLVGQLSSLTMLLQLQVMSGIVFFRLYAALVGLRPFTKQALAGREKIVSQWSYGPVALARKLFRPLRSLTLLAYYEHPAVQSLLDSGRKSIEQVATVQLHQSTAVNE